ncbi:MAG: hypothetical protein AAB110_07780 [Candidatus Desantisbacteria bacterium]|mgnify:CR=1 FL=1
MLNTLWAVAQDRKIELLEKVDIPDGTKVLVTLLPDGGEQQFWQNVSRVSLGAVWDNPEDDVYAQLLKR